MFVLLEEDSNIIDLFNVDFLFFYIFFIDELWIIIIINIEYGNLKRELYLVFCGMRDIFGFVVMIICWDFIFFEGNFWG